MAGKQKPDAPTGVTPNVAPTEAVAERTALVIAKKLNLRHGPSREHPVKAVLDQGTSLELFSLPDEVNVPGWAAVRVALNLVGWVDVRFIQEQRTEQSFSKCGRA